MTRLREGNAATQSRSEDQQGERRRVDVAAEAADVAAAALLPDLEYPGAGRGARFDKGLQQALVPVANGNPVHQVDIPEWQLLVPPRHLSQQEVGDQVPRCLLRLGRRRNDTILELRPSNRPRGTLIYEGNMSGDEMMLNVAGTTGNKLTLIAMRQE